MARNTSRQARVKPETTGQLSVADTLFAITAQKYPNAAAEFLPADAAKERAIGEFQRANAAKLAALSPATVMPEAKRGNLIRVAFRAVTESRQMKYLSRAALLLVAFGAGLTLLNFFGDDSIRIVDELGKSALNAEFGGSVLAPQASVSNSISLDGTLIAASLTQRGELHQYSFTGTLPGLSAPPATALRIDEPAGWALLGASAIAGLATRRRRRR